MTFSLSGMRSSVVTALVLIACNSGGKHAGSHFEAASSSVAASATQPPKKLSEQVVPLVRLIATPASFDGKLVETCGFLSTEFEVTTLWLSQGDYEQVSMAPNAIWVEFHACMGTDWPAVEKPGADQLNLKYACLTGIFDSNRHGHRGKYGGTLCGLKRVTAWPKRASAQSPESVSPFSTGR